VDFPPLYQENAAFVWRSLRRLGVREADLPDAAQEVFLVVHRRLHEYDGASPVRTWLFAIAMRCASDHRRRAHVRRETLAAEPPPQSVPADQAEALRRGRARELLQKILDGLDDDKRAVFILFELEQLPMSEVAPMLGVPLQTAYSRLHAARKHVEDAIGRARLRDGGV
jgi:RNA polymerase sigma-70 factor (ECF subfamily)